jgi:hypothetical protein
MPEFTTVSMTEAMLRTASGRQGRYLYKYIDYITKLPTGQAGKFRIGEEEKPATIRRRLVVAAKTLAIPLIIKRSGNELYFWREAREAEQPRTKRSYTRRRMGREEMTTPDQPFSASDEVDYRAPREESPELGQTEQAVEDAMRRVDPE